MRPTTFREVESNVTAQVISTRLPAGYTIRAPRIDDVAEVLQVVHARSIADTGSTSTSADDILMYWQEPERNLDEDDWLVIGPDGRISAFMELYEYAPYTTFEFDHYVHPDAENLGIESALFEIIETRARREMHRAPDGERVVLHTFSPSTARYRQRQLEAAGFSHIRDGLQMLIDLDDVQAPTLPVGINIRWLIRDRDERAVWEAAEASWQDMWGFAPMSFEEFCYFRIESVRDFDPTLWHLATEGDDIAGVALCLPEKEGFPETGWVSLLGVRREYRGRGVGMALLKHAFSDFQRRGYKHVGLGVDASSITGADRLYRNAGMREVKREFIYEKVLREAGT